MQTISAAAAISLGLTRYFTGHPCRHGHTGERYAVGRKCIQCTIEQANAWALRNPLKVRAKLRKHLCGVSEEHFQEMHRAQDGRCAICQESLSETESRRVHLDHDHTTGLARGILCSRCNTGLGKFLDDPEIFERAAAYLRESRVLAELLR